MKQFILLVAALVFLSGGAIAANAKGPETMTIKGTIVDNQCANAHKDTESEFIKTHTKECALACAKSGYSIFANGSLVAFDSPSSKRIEAFLKKKDSKLTVAVVVKKAGDKYSLVSIKND